MEIPLSQKILLSVVSYKCHACGNPSLQFDEIDRIESKAKMKCKECGRLEKRNVTWIGPSGQTLDALPFWVIRKPMPETYAEYTDILKSLAGRQLVRGRVVDNVNITK